MCSHNDQDTCHMVKESWFNLWQNKRFFSSPKQTASGTHTVSYTMGTMRTPLKLQWPLCEADHAPPSSSRVKNEWCYTPSPPICLPGAGRNNFALFAFHIFVYLQPLCLQSFCHIIQYGGTMIEWHFWDGQSHLLVIFFFSATNL
jgi:hypothetical protein